MNRVEFEPGRFGRARWRSGPLGGRELSPHSLLERTRRLSPSPRFNVTSLIQNLFGYNRDGDRANCFQTKTIESFCEKCRELSEIGL